MRQAPHQRFPRVARVVRGLLSAWFMTRTPLPIAVTTNPHFARFGGEAAVRRLVEAFYDAMDTRADARTIRAMHAADLGATKAVLVDYLSEWMGGPKRYSATRGQPMLRRRHHPFDIDDGARNAWMACMRQALAASGAEPALCAELEAAFGKIADHIRNTEPHFHPPRGTP